MWHHFLRSAVINNLNTNFDPGCPTACLLSCLLSLWPSSQKCKSGACTVEAQKVVVFELSGVRCVKTRRSRSVDSPPEVCVWKRKMHTHSFQQTSKMLQTQVRRGKHVSIRTQKRGVTWTRSDFYFPTWLKPDATDVSWINVCCLKRSILCVAVKALRNK